MSKVQKVVKVITGQYTNAQGQQKNRYMKIGSIIETKNGPMLKLDANPFVKGGWDGWAYLNDPDPVEGEQPRQPAHQGSGFDDMDNDIPF